MGFRIQNNMSAYVANRNLTKNEEMMRKSLEKLSSGYRINSGADDAAGLASSMRFRAEISSLKVASRNAAQASSLLQVAEGAMSQVELILVRLKELATQASSGNSGADLEKIDAEATALESEISRIVGFTQYDGHTLIDGSFGTTVLSSTAPVDFGPGNGVEHIDVTTAEGNSTYFVSAISYSANTMTLSDGTTSQMIDYSLAMGMEPNENFVMDFSQLGVKITVNSAFESNETNFVEGTAATASRLYTGSLGLATFQLGDVNDGFNRIGFALPDLSLASLAGGSSADIDLSSTLSAQNALETIETSISTLALARADVGALLNRLSYTSSNLAVSIENKTATESIIRDVDMAGEMSEFTKYQILMQSSISMLAQANQVPQSLLQLLK